MTFLFFDSESKKESRKVEYLNSATRNTCVNLFFIYEFSIWKLGLLLTWTTQQLICDSFLEQKLDKTDTVQCAHSAKQHYTFLYVSKVD